MGGKLKLPGGININLGKKGVGASINKKGFGVGIGPNGARIRGSIPGTGLSWSESVPAGKLQKLKEAFFGGGKKKEDDKKKEFDKEIELNADVVCVMCGKEIKKFASDIAKKEFNDAGDVCKECRREMIT